MEFPGSKWLLPLRVALVPVYWIGYRIHRAMYRFGLKRRTRLEKPVICIGNLTVGGSGKTPVVIALADLLQGMGIKVGIVSRGYKRTSVSDAPLVVSDGNEIMATVSEAGDEPLLIAQRAPKAAVIVCSRRAAGGWLAIERYGCDVILLDDGFQHWALERDMDLVCIDAALPLRRARLIPWGVFREPPSEIGRASAVFLTQTSQPEALREQERFLKELKFSGPIWRAPAQPSAIISFGSGEKLPLEALRGKRLVAACAIGRPQYFIERLKSLGAEVLGSFSLPDHDPFRDETIERIERVAGERGAEMIVTTAKDFMKLQNRVGENPPWYFLDIAIQWSDTQRASIHYFLHTEIERAQNARQTD